MKNEILWNDNFLFQQKWNFLKKKFARINQDVSKEDSFEFRYERKT